MSNANPTKTKILTIQFKYLGDAVFITPALKALQAAYPEAELHILTAKEIAPIFENLPWITKVWALPRTRGKAKVSQTWPFIRKLRQEKFDQSVDFAGNDRGAILSLLIGAKSRISSIEKEPSFLQKIAYTRTIKNDALPSTWVKRHLHLLNLGWGTPLPASEKTTLASDANLAEPARKILGKHSVICHLGTSQPRKEWPVKKWHNLYKLAKTAGYRMAFSAGTNERELGLIEELKKLSPDIYVLPPTDLPMFLAILNESKFVISGDTGPLHFAAGLGVKIIGLFAVQDGVQHYAPIYKKNEVVIGDKCTCTGELVHFVTCQSPAPCMNSISAERVFELLKERYPLNVA